MNPFVYGDYVKESKFINRKEEIKSLTRDLIDSQKIFLISPRRFGKTSLLKHVMKELDKKNIKVAYVDLFKCSSLEQFIAAFAKALSMFEVVSVDRTIKFLKEFISSLRPFISIKHDGDISIQIDAKPREQETYNIFEDLLEYPHNYATKHDTKVVIMFDEFQEIIKFGGENIEKFMRAIIQTQDRVGYVFSGSKREILNEMVSKRSRAFFGMGPVVYLDKIEEKEWIKYIQKTYNDNGFEIEDDVPKLILDRVNNIPYYIQFLAHELWDIYYDSKIIKVEYIEDTVVSIVNRNCPAFEMIWENLTSLQQRVLQGIVLDDIDNIFSNEFLNRHQINSRQTLVRTIQLLIKKDVIEKHKKKYVFTDLWFGEWIKYFIL